MLVQFTLLFLFILHSGLSLRMKNICKEGETKDCLAGRNVTDMKEHPYHVSVQFYRRHRWSGAIISKDWVITTAHRFTVYKGLYKYFSIQAGSGNVSFLSDDSSAVVIPVSKVIIHEKYENVSSDYNIALLQLESPLSFSPRIQPIPLANWDIIDAYGNIDIDKQIMSATMTGWGSFCNASNWALQLRKMEVSLVSHEWCAEVYFKGHCNITTNMICAKYMDPGDCKDEPGSPLLFHGHLLGLLPLTCVKTFTIPFRMFMFIGTLRTWIFEKTGV